VFTQRVLSSWPRLCERGIIIHRRAWHFMSKKTNITVSFYNQNQVIIRDSGLLSLKLCEYTLVWVSTWKMETEPPDLESETDRDWNLEGTRQIKEVFCRVVRFKLWKRSWLFEPYADWITSEVKKCKCGDFASIKLTNVFQFFIICKRTNNANNATYWS